MKRDITRWVGLVTALLLATGCGEEDCPSCPAPAPQLYVIGEATFDAPWTLNVDISAYNVAGTHHAVDDALADDYILCVRRVPDAVAEDGHQLIGSWGSGNCASGVIPEFTATDTTVFTFFCDGIAHRAGLHLLDPDGAVPLNLTAEVEDETGPATGSTLSVSWDPVAGAEWYSLRVRSKANFSGWYGWDYLCVDGTNGSIPLLLTRSQLLDVRVYVAAGTGPRPDDSGRRYNMSGPHVVGAIYSVSNDAYLYLEVSPIAGAGVHAGEWIEPPGVRDRTGSN